MPVTPVLIASLNATMPANTIAGINSNLLATAIGTTIGAWANIPTNITLNGVTAGTMGAGLVSGKMTVAPNTGFYISSFNAFTLNGLNHSGLGNALSTSISLAFSTALYSGFSAGVGVGSDTSKVTVVNGATLRTFLIGGLSAFSFNGINVSNLCSAISQGVSKQLLTGFGNGVVAGPPLPLPSSGTSVCMVVI